MKKYRFLIYLFILFFIFQSCPKDDEDDNEEDGEELNTVKDIDGNMYKTVTIGTQTWMAENLKTTKYNDGTAIPIITDNSEWDALTTGAYCWYDNDINNKNIYGALYNWFTVKIGKLCPNGWHVPTDAEWTVLTTFLGGEAVAGGKMKSTTVEWKTPPNIGATNESGFSGLPGGIRLKEGDFDSIGIAGVWWSSTDGSTSTAWSRILQCNYTGIHLNRHGRAFGLSVRCLKD